jgi:glyoxylase-like metal-dependent hydrolase (beta-lactamase superfamily II)
MLGGQGSPAPDRLLADGDTVWVGATALKVLHTPGHTPGGICLYTRGHVFTGDTLFPGGGGKTWSTPDFDRLYADVTEKLFAKLPDETWVYPGHGSDTTLGSERPFLAEWKSRGW